MEQDDINGAFAAQEVAEKKLAEEVEIIDDLGNAKATQDAHSPEEEKRLVRKLDLWYDIQPSKKRS
jgi:hypothetical protein